MPLVVPSLVSVCVLVRLPWVGERKTRVLSWSRHLRCRVGVLLGTVTMTGRLVAWSVRASVVVKVLAEVLTTGRLGVSVRRLVVRVSTFLVRVLWDALAGLLKLRQVHSCFPRL